MDEVGARGPVGLYTCDPRGVLPIEGFRVPRSVRRALRARRYAIRVDGAFTEQSPRPVPARAPAGRGLRRAWWPRTCGSTGPGGRTASRPGTATAWRAGSSASRSAASSPPRRCSTGPRTRGTPPWWARPAARGGRLHALGHPDDVAAHLRFGALALTPEEYRGRLADALDVRPRPLV